ncbi:sensor domain-containing diguanylate cyclase [Vulcaniibacterium gelatinicum]|uniref:sensor domain-containing diguanylate cyclase n=1 Tax=Vulcaniibacterium gelatinicum TaxID=2598725 RepID=UPI0011C924BD|nr:EAL domain-containing protein [Vulcaniibacterium gelatinicum]
MQQSGAEAGSRTTAPEALAVRLLQAATPEAVAEVLCARLAEQGIEGTVLWSAAWPGDIRAHPPARATSALFDAACGAIAAHRTRHAPPADLHVLSDDGEHVAALLHCAGGQPDPATIAAAGMRMAETLAMQQLHDTVARLEQSEKLQRALYAIADLAGSDLDMPAMLRELHRIVSDLMYAENFFLALYDRERDSVRFLYFVDTVDPEPPAQDEEFPLSRFEHSLSWYVIRDAKPLMGTTEELRRQVSGPLQLHGADSYDWLGVPLMRNGRVHGVMVVQTYIPGMRYTRAEMALLSFVAEHVLTALERKQRHADLEQRVRERTAQLDLAITELRREVAERERGEQLQAALYRIAALASTDESTERFYRHVHSIVGELINARNFYIALLSDDRSQVHFPYVVDEHGAQWESRPFGRGLTEYVVRCGTPQLVDMARAAQLAQAGEIDDYIVGEPSLMWLGAPLFGEDEVIGVVAVQTYSPDVRYDERDAELLRFVSYQIASSLQRRRAAELLVRANAELERRVEERTRELRAEIEVRQQVEAMLKHQVLHDPLTGLPNRVYMRERIERALAAVRRDRNYRFGVLYLDVDRFKLVNDTLGHLAGDQVLQEVARRLSRSVREPDVVARLSGDEFAILLEHVQIPETATKVAQRVIQAMAKPMEVVGQTIQVGASIGMAMGDHRYATVDDVLRDADTALYRAKTTGRNRLVLFDEQLHQAAMNVLELEQDLRRAITHDEFLPYFQPLVRLEDGAVVGYEALLRWRHPRRGLLAPGEFLATAEDSGLIEQIDWRMFRLSMVHSRSFLHPDQFLTINVSPRLFQYGDLDQRLLALTSETGFPASQLRIEVTEGTLLGDPATVAVVLERLRAACIEAALDDFGTGYSSLGHVHLFPLKMIKIDRSFVEAVSAKDNTRSNAVIGAILALARSLGLEVVAEGIETEAQRRALQEMGCPYGQGYLFARPGPGEQWRPA